MATRTAVDDSRSPVFRVAKWSGLSQGDDGEPFKFAKPPHGSVLVQGNFSGGALIYIEGSYDWDPDLATGNFFTLHNKQGLDLIFASAGTYSIDEIVPYIRPRVVSGDGSTDCIAYVSGHP